MSELSEFLEKRKKTLEALDIDHARELFPQASSDEVLLASLHKARYECVDIADGLRHESRAWLENNGYLRMFGLEWPEDKQYLPTSGMDT